MKPPCMLIAWIESHDPDVKEVRFTRLVPAVRALRALERTPSLFFCIFPPTKLLVNLRF